MYYKLPIVHQPTQKFFASWVEGGGGKSYLTDWMGLLNLPLHIILINDIFKSTETEPSSTDVALLELVV